MGLIKVFRYLNGPQNRTSCWLIIQYEKYNDTILCIALNFVTGNFPKCTDIVTWELCATDRQQYFAMYRLKQPRGWFTETTIFFDNLSKNSQHRKDDLTSQNTLQCTADIQQTRQSQGLLYKHRFDSFIN